MSELPQHLADSPRRGLSGRGPARACASRVLGYLSGTIDRLFLCVTYRSARAFVTAAVAAFLVGLSGLFAFSWYVNPWGDFGPTGYRRKYNARLAKANYLDSLPRDALPQVVVLGSSNTMRYVPATIERRLGKTAFNFAVFWGRTEDFLCIVCHLVKDLEYRPELLIVGVDMLTFGPALDRHPVFPGTRRRLLNTPQLVRHHPDVNRIVLYWANFIDAFSRQQLAISWRLVHDKRGARATQAPLAESEMFSGDGTRHWYGEPFTYDREIFEEVETGRYPITQKLRAIVAEDRLEKLAHEIWLYTFERFNERRVDYMERLLALCDREGVQVVFAINPVHPVFLEVLRHKPAYQRNLEHLKSLLERFERDYPIVAGTVDASRIASFGGDPDGFYDAIHPATRNCELIIDRIAELLESR